jgi:hypothetical protein
MDGKYSGYTIEDTVGSDRPGKRAEEQNKDQLHDDAPNEIRTIESEFFTLC